MAEPVTAHELDVARDMARKSVVVAAVLVAASAAVWGLDGALSSLYSVVLVVLNLVAAAGLISWGAKRGGSFLMAAVMGGYLVRLGVLTVAIVLVKDSSWIERAPLFITLLVTHLGLLLWETRSVSLSLAYPGLKPSPALIRGDKKESTTR
jgi:preprotein translocase subunit SecE